MIGAFKPNTKNWKIGNHCVCQIIHVKYLKVILKPIVDLFINLTQIINHTFTKTETVNLETETPIYNQVVQQENIELQTHEIFESKDGTILDVNTDCI